MIELIKKLDCFVLFLFYFLPKDSLHLNNCPVVPTKKELSYDVRFVIYYLFYLLILQGGGLSLRLERTLASPSILECCKSILIFFIFGFLIRADNTAAG